MFMTLMLILGAIAALYCLRLLFRSAKFALPVCAAIALGFALRDLGFGWLTILGSALIAGLAVLALGRRLVGGAAPFPVKLCVILMFVGAAAFAGYQAGTALAILGGLEAGAKHGLAFLSGLLTGYASWRDLVSPAVSAERPALSV
jgi:predicted anti-sigma-YlaC factor YlaD